MEDQNKVEYEIEGERIARRAYDSFANRTHHQPSSSGVQAFVNPSWGRLVRSLVDEPARVNFNVRAAFSACGGQQKM
jgi:hypothetical protein